jgi:hypothetical protein
MAVTGEFKADFTSFYDAVQKASAELRTFNDDAAKVEKQLSSMADKFSGRRLIQEATLMSKAIEEAGGIARLTEAELARVGKTANEAADKMKRLGMEVPADLQQLADATKGAAEDTSVLGVNVTKLIASYVSIEAVLALATTGFHLLADGIAASIASASEAETNDRALLAALEAQGLAMPSVLAAYQDYAAELQKTTTYSGDAATAAQAMLTTFGVMPKDMEAATLAAANLAAKFGKDLPDAARMVGQIVSGGTEQIEKLGVSMTDAEGKSVTFATAVDNINSKFSGAAAAAADTYAGRIQQLDNAWDNVQTTIGRAIVQNETVKTLITEITRLLGDHNTELESSARVNNLVSDAVILLAKGLGLAATAVDLAHGKFTEFRLTIDAIGIATGAFHGRAVDFLEDAQAAAKSSLEWKAGTAALQAEMAALEKRLEATRGQTSKLTAAQEEDLKKKNELTKRLQEEENRAKEVAAEKLAAQKKLDAAMQELDSIGQSYTETLAGMNKEMVAGIAAYLEAGASQSTLATAYGVTAAQVRAVAESLKVEAEATKAATKLHEQQAQIMNRLDLEYTRASADRSQSLMELQIQNAFDTAKARIEALRISGELTEEMADKLMALAERQKENIIRNTLEADENSRASYEARLLDAQNYYAQVMSFQENYTAEQIAAAAAAVDAAAMDLQNWANIANQQTQHVAAGATIAADAINSVNSALGVLAGTFQLPQGGNGESYAPPGYVTSNVNPMLAYELSNRYGETRASPIKLPANMGATVNVQPGAVQMNYPIMNDPQAMDQIAKLFGNSIMAKLTRSGTV